MPESRFNLLQIRVYCRSSVIFPLKFSLNDKSTGPKIDVRRPRFNGERLIGANNLHYRDEEWIDVDSFVEDAFSIARELNVLRIGAISNECRAFSF